MIRENIKVSWWPSFTSVLPPHCFKRFSYNISDESFALPARKEKKKKKSKDVTEESLGDIQTSQSFSVEPSEKKVSMASSKCWVIHESVLNYDKSRFLGSVGHVKMASAVEAF